MNGGWGRSTWGPAASTVFSFMWKTPPTPTVTLARTERTAIDSDVSTAESREAAVRFETRTSCTGGALESRSAINDGGRLDQQTHRFINAIHTAVAQRRHFRARREADAESDAAAV